MFKLGDDGSLDTVLYCDKCKHEVRYNFCYGGEHTCEPNPNPPYLTPGECGCYDLFVEWAIKDAEEEHDCFEGGEV